MVVENVQDSPRRIWLDAQKIQWGSFAELNAWLGERCRSLWSELRHPEYRQLSVLEMLEQERAELMPMPTPFDGYVENPAWVSSTCLGHGGAQPLLRAVGGSQSQHPAVSESDQHRGSNAIVASHELLICRGRIRRDWQHRIDLVQRRPWALRNGAPFADLPAPLQRLRQGVLRHAGGDKVMAQVLAAVPTAGLEAVLVAVELVIESGALSAEHVLNVLARLDAKPAPEAVQTTLHLQEAPQANTSRYDCLRSAMDLASNTVEVSHA